MATVLAFQPVAAATSATELAQALQRKYNTVRDFSADFVHVYRGGVLKKQITEKGHLLIKKPGKMRWDYTSPEAKQFVSDGVKLYSYIPADKQVIVGTIPKEDIANSPAMFLAGKGDITRDYAATLVDSPAGSPAGTTALKLVPHTPQPDYDWLIVLLDPDSLALRGLVTADAQGGTSVFMFSNLKENVALSDKDFTFQMPRGVDVITEGQGR